MTRIGLTFDEHFDLRMKPLAGADPAFCEAAEQERDRMFPMATATASHHLRSRGYDCRPAILEALVRQGVVTPSQPEAWMQADVDAAADHLEEAGILTPYAAMCLALGCRYADFLRSLREAAERESAKYGRPVRPDDQLFVMHRVPPRESTPAVISFTLCDDIRERLERGEEV
ncbi:MAG: hypothetical protein HRU76_05910 [Phycisphaeraceae bacterium]|nr:MAG: hypothetical protein HRU76_05910 [Phycisphaeraceae bacterium]